MTAIRFSAAAENDIYDLLLRTDALFGPLARSRYETLLVVAVRDLAADPLLLGSVARPELGDAVRSYHLRHSRQRTPSGDGTVRRPRHLLLYRILQPNLVGIGRVLHDSMELERHLPSDFGEA